MLTFHFTDVIGFMSESEELTSGMVGKQVQILVDEDWQNLSRTYVFRAGDICRTTDGTEPIATIPEEVLRQPFQKLFVGVYCTDAEGTLVIPTMMAEGPLIRYGADPIQDPAAEELPVWKKLQAQIGNLSGLDTDNKSSLVSAINELCFKISLGSGGLDKDAAALLIQILRAAVYTSNQTANIANLERMLTASSAGEIAPSLPSDPEDPEVILTHISASYSGGSVAVGTSVQDLTGIEAVAFYSDGTSETVTGYTLSGEIAEGSNSITVSYGGKTAVITVVGTAESGDVHQLAADYDFTVSLTDAVTGTVMTTSGCTQDSQGLHFTSATAYALSGIDCRGKTIEVEFGAVEKQGTAHGRCLTFTNSATSPALNGQGLIWHNNGQWAIYGMEVNGWVDKGITDVNIIANSTITIPYKGAGVPAAILCNGETFIETQFDLQSCGYLVLGSSTTAFYNMTIRKLRIYEGV